MTEFERVDLPSGGYAVIRDPDTITVRQRRPLQRIMMRVGFDGDLQALIRHQGRIIRERENAEKAAADAGEEFDDDAWEPSIPSPVRQADLTDDQLDLLGALAEAVTVALVESWSFDVPVSQDALQDLSQVDYDALVAAAAKYREALIPSFAVDPDPESPTEPSGESADS